MKTCAIVLDRVLFYKYGIRYQFAKTGGECRTRYIGLDVHKDNITACVLSDAGKVVLEMDFKKTDGTCEGLDEMRLSILNDC